MFFVNLAALKICVSISAVVGLVCTAAYASDVNSTAWIDYSTRNSSGVTVTRILDKQAVSEAQVNALQSSIANHNGRVYTANIEPGVDGDVNGINLWTVLRQGEVSESGEWVWSSKLLEDHTVYNPWHTAPAVGVDEHGYVHVAYNMHNTPWQYARSVTPENILGFEFLGQAISTDELRRLKYQNRASFPDLGSAAIPGNQITYPSFTKDNSGSLHVAYRFAARPDQSFDRRTMSAGIASYNVDTREWSSVGGQLWLEDDDWARAEGASTVSTPFGASLGWTASSPQLAFDSNNRMYAGMTWRQGIAGVQYSRPCVFQSDDRLNFHTPNNVYQALPVTADDCSMSGMQAMDQYYNMASMVVDHEGVIYYLAHSLSEGVVMFRHDPDEDFWRRERGLNGISDLFVDGEGSLWAVASGLRVLKRNKNEGVWQTIYDNEGGGDCFPRVSMDANKQFAFVHTQSCDNKSVSIYSVQLH